MKMLREGMQDYEYLNLLTKLGDGAFAQTELAKVVTAANSFTPDPAVLDQARVDMAQEIEKDLAGLDGGSGGVAGACDGGAGAAAAADGGAATGDDGGATDGGPSGEKGAGDASSTSGPRSGSSSGCGCTLAGEAPTVRWGLVGTGMLAAAFAGRRARRARRLQGAFRR
jgi:hypothetical protein